MTLDYRELLKKYMNHVGEDEGSLFLHSLGQTEVVFSKAESDELNAIADELSES